MLKTTDAVDNEEVFAPFSEARAALAEWFGSVSRAYMNAAADARKLRKSAALPHCLLDMP